MNFYDRLAPEYDRLHRDPTSRAENAAVSFMLHRRIEDDDMVADLGCGTGIALDLMPHQLASRYVGFDPAPSMVTEARMKWPNRTFIEQPMEHAPYFVHTVDVAISLFGSLSYVGEPWLAFENMGRIVKPDGRVFVMVYGRRYEHRPTYVGRGHDLGQTFYDPDVLRSLLCDAAGLSDVRVRGMTFRDVYGPLGPQTILLESLTLGKVAPGRAYWLIGEGSR